MHPIVSLENIRERATPLSIWMLSWVFYSKELSSETLFNSERLSELSIQCIFPRRFGGTNISLVISSNHFIQLIFQHHQALPIKNTQNLWNSFCSLHYCNSYCKKQTWWFFGSALVRGGNCCGHEIWLPTMIYALNIQLHGDVCVGFTHSIQTRGEDVIICYFLALLIFPSIRPLTAALQKKA